MDGTLLVAGGTALLTGLGMTEFFFHRRNLRSIPIRIHVNGTRGKSGVTRLIAAGLRAGGIRTCAKTTGTLPRMIFPDGSEYPVFRPARTNVIEQIRIVRSAAKAKAQALVVECMALQPALQSLCELKLIQATHGVITNCRPDHMDVMGPSTGDVAKALAGTVPAGTTLYTAEQRHLGMLRYAAQDRKSSVVAIDDDDVAAVTWDELERFPYIEHPDNVALALKVCTDVGVDRQTALQGMWQATPDAGVMTVYQVYENQQHIAFVNGFAANDPESTGKIWEMILQRNARLQRSIAIVNCRADRVDRSNQLAESCVEWTRADHYLVVGTATDVFAKRAIEMGLDPNRITQAERASVNQLANRISRLAGDSAVVMGMGNISGPGLELVNYFRQRNGIEPRMATTEVATIPVRKAA